MSACAAGLASRFVVMAVAGIAAFAAAGGVAHADPVYLPAGNNFLQTNWRSSTFPVEAMTLPAGYFGTQGGVPSDPVILQPMVFSSGPLVHGPYDTLFIQPVSALPCVGRSLSTALGAIGGYPDTSIRRLDPLLLPQIGDSATIRLQMDQLSLQAVLPLAVTYGGASESFFDVFITLDPAVTQGIGLATLTRTSDWEALMVLRYDPSDPVNHPGLPVDYRVGFVNQDVGGPGAAAMTFHDTWSSPLPTRMEVVPAPASGCLLVAGVLAASVRRRRPR